jgi:hypothetical protein
MWVWVAVGLLDIFWRTPRLFKLDNLALLCCFFFGIMGVLCFNSIENSSTCHKILQCPTYVHNKKGTLLFVALLPCYYCGVYFCYTMMLVAAGSYMRHCNSAAQSKHKDLI